MPNPPKLAFACRAENAGNVSLFIVKDGKPGEGLGMPAKNVGTIVASLLAAAKEASEKAGLAPLEQGTSLDGVPVLQISKTGLAQGPLPGTLALILHAGRARLGIHLDQKHARSLGEALLAASAPIDRQQ